MSSKSPGKNGKNKKMVAYKVTMLDDTEIPFQIDSKALGIELINRVYEFLKLIESDYFGLEYVDVKGKKHWIDYDKALNKQLTQFTRIYFIVKFYTPDPSQLEEEYTRYLYALQIKRDLLEGYLLCSDATASLLASYIVQAELGDYQQDSCANDPSYFSNRRFFPHQNPEHELKIMEYHKNHVGQQPGDADLNLLDIARKIEMYGIVMHSAKDHESVCLNLAVAHMGILVFQNYTKINTFSWAKIRKLSFKRKKFLIKLHPENYGFYKDTVEFYFDDRDDSKAFWKKCIECHSFFRCTASAKLKQGKSRSLLKPRGSSFRYYGRTQKELIDLARENFTKNRTFDRSYHSMKSIDTSLSGTTTNMNGTQSLNRNFFSKTQPTSPSQSVHKTATLRSQDTSISSHSHYLDRRPHLVHQSQHASPNEYDYDSFLGPHDANTIDSRFSIEKIIDTDDSIDETSPLPLPPPPQTSHKKEPQIENSSMNKIYSRKEVITTYKKEEIKEEYSSKSIHYDNYQHHDNTNGQQSKQLKLNDDGKRFVFSSFLPSNTSESESECDFKTRVSSLSEFLRKSSSSSLISSNHHKGSSSSSSSLYLSSSLASLFGGVSDSLLSKANTERLIGSQYYKNVSNGSQSTCVMKSIELINQKIIKNQEVTLNMVHINDAEKRVKNEKEPLCNDVDDADDDNKRDVYNLESKTRRLPLLRNYTYAERSNASVKPIIKKIVMKNASNNVHTPSPTQLTSFEQLTKQQQDQTFILDYQEPLNVNTQNQAKMSYVIPIEKSDSKTNSPIYVDEELKKKLRPINDETYFIAKEILMTERTYKKDLEIVVKNCFTFIESYINSNMNMFSTLNVLLFTNLNSIYRFHDQFLKEFEHRMAYWSEDKHQKLSDLLLDLNLILKIYKLYIENYDELLNELDLACRRDKKFDSLYKDFEQQKLCYLPLIQLLLKPIQRIYHYKLLFQRLLIIYGLNHVEYKDIFNVFSIVEDLYQLINKNIYNIENKQKIIELQRELTGAENLLPISIRANRIFIREGSLQKISKKGYNQRMFFLFSDVLLYCARSSSSTLQFKVHDEYRLDEIQIEDGNTQINIPNSFTIYHSNRSLLVSAVSHDEKMKWLKDIQEAIEKLKSNHQSNVYTTLRQSNSMDNKMDRVDSGDIMQEQEVYDNQMDIVNLNLQQQQQQRANTTMHVCWHRNTSLSALDNHKSTIYQLSGYLLRKFKNSNGWQKLWVVFTNFCLFFYKTYQDESPLASLPLLAYSITSPTSTDNIIKEFVFKLQFKNHVYFFRAESQYSYERWLEVISSAAQKF